MIYVSLPEGNDGNAMMGVMMVQSTCFMTRNYVFVMIKPLVIQHSFGESPCFLHGKLTVSMAMFKGYVRS